MTRAILDTSTDPTTAYAAAVVDGALVTGLPVLWACQRHLEDLEDGQERGLWFDADAAAHVFEFCSLLRHFEGTLGRGPGQQWELEPWQQFILGSVFGWRRENGLRRFREAWIEVARKNGKSFMAAAVGNYLLVCDGEPGAQIYTAATKRDQARIIHRAAIAQRDKTPHLREMVTKRRDRLIYHDTRSFFAPLGQDSRTEDGLNPHGAILDEVHAHRDGGMWDVLESAMVSRGQPLIFATTTAGIGAGSFGRQQHDYYRAVLDPESGVENDAVFAYIAELDLDEGDDPYNELLWEKANPNLGVSVRIETLRERAQKARQSPRFETDFMVKNLNVWAQHESRWLSSQRWDACAAELDLEELQKRPCFAGLDLSSNTDLTSYVLYFPSTPTHPKAATLPFFWVPAENVEVRARQDRVDYSSWIQDGHIETTPGDWVDQERIKERIKELRTEFPRLQKLALDMKFAAKLSVELQGAGFDVVRFPQGYSAYCAPTQELERLILSEGIEHDGNPVLRWNAGNVVLKEGSEGDVMPSKKKSRERIDGVVALIMAIGVAGRHPAQQIRPPTHRSLSKSRGRPKRQIYNVFR